LLEEGRPWKGLVCGCHQRVEGNPALVVMILDLFASRTESDLGIEVDRFWRPSLK
jgi:hypothetical protein